MDNVIEIQDRWTNSFWEEKTHKTIIKISKMTKTNYNKISRALQRSETVQYLAIIIHFPSNELLKGYLLWKMDCLRKSMNLYFHLFEINFWAKSTSYPATIVLFCSKWATDGLRLYEIILCKTGYPWANSQNQRIYILINSKFISEQNRQATRLLLHSFVADGLPILKNWLPMRCLTKSTSLYFH